MNTTLTKKETKKLRKLSEAFRLQSKLRKREERFPLSGLSIDEIALEASLCRDSFFDFVVRFWDTVIPEEPIWNWHIEELCKILQEAAERVFKNEDRKEDIIINIPPGTTKSTICSIMFPAWVWTRMPSARSLCASFADKLALDLSRRSRDIVESEKWQKLFGQIELRDDQNAKGCFINNKGGMRYAVGTNGAITGFHGHFIIIDDPIDPNGAYSEADLKAANRWVSETLRNRKVDKRKTLTILIMQRLHQNDPTAVLLEKALKKGSPVKHVNLPAEIVGSGRGDVRPRRLAKFYRDRLLDPVRISRAVLNEAQVDLGEYGYSGQFLQRPVPREGGMFKYTRIRLGVAPLLRHFTQLVRFWDKAGTHVSASKKKSRAAWTVGVLMGEDKDGKFWILDVVRGQWDSAEREEKILQTSKQDLSVARRSDGRSCYQVAFEQEPGSGGKESAEQSAKRHAGFRVRIERPTGDKETRADPFSVQVNMGNVLMVEAEWNSVYLNELQYFPNSTYKDQVDASSGAFTVLTKKRLRIGAYPEG